MSIAIEILKAVRGEQSALSLSKELGFDTNKVYRWESGHARLTWKDFITLVKIKKTFDQRRFYDLTLFVGNIESFDDITNYFLNEGSLEKLKGKMDISSSQIKKWCKEDASPDADVVFAIFEVSKFSLKGLVKVFGGDNVAPENFLDKVAEEEVEISYYKICPFFGTFRCFIAKNSFLTLEQLTVRMLETFGIPITAAQKMVLDLEHAGFLTRDENELFYQVNSKKNVHTALDVDKKSVLNIIKSWASLSFDKMSREESFDEDKIRLGFSEVIIPEEATDEVLNLWIETYKKLHEIQDKYKDCEADKAYVFTSQLIRSDNEKIYNYFSSSDNSF